MKTKLVIYYSVLYFLLAFLTLNFNYIEGDDARTVMYHVMGRYQNFQPAYSSYHSMFDSTLSLVDSNDEIVLRYFSIGVSFLFGLLSLLSLAYLILLKTKQNKLVFFLLVLLPFMIPEILFSSLVINSTLISITFILISHILFLNYIDSTRGVYLIGSIILFGFGVSYRWINGFYLFVLYGEYILNETKFLKNLFLIERIKKSFIIFPIFIISVIVFIQLSGFSLIDIYETFMFGSSYLDNKEVSYYALIATGIAFITPSLILLILLGILYCIRTGNYRNIILLLISILPFFFVGFYPSYKYLITIIYVLVLLSAQGISFSKNPYFKWGIVLLVFCTWFFGIEIKSNSAWGPKFEVQLNKKELKNINSYNPDKTLKIKEINIVLGSGIAMPTLEGPRPLYGFGAVFISKWFQFIEKNNTERFDAVYYAEINHCKIIQDVNHSFISSKLVELGYSTKHKFSRFEKGKFEREFKKKNNLIQINVFNDKNKLFNKVLMNEFLYDDKQVVVYSSYTNIITKLKSVYKEKFLQMGAYWGVLKK